MIFILALIAAGAAPFFGGFLAYLEVGIPQTILISFVYGGAVGLIVHNYLTREII